MGLRKQAKTLSKGRTEAVWAIWPRPDGLEKSGHLASLREGRPDSQRDRWPHLDDGERFPGGDRPNPLPERFCKQGEIRADGIPLSDEVRQALIEHCDEVDLVVSTHVIR